MSSFALLETSSINLEKSSAFLEVITGFPVSFSISFRALPAIVPPRLAVSLFSSRPIGFSMLVNSVVVASAHVEHQFKGGHVVAKVFFFKIFIVFVLPCGHAAPGF